ncbi:gamma-secretase subunit APH-1B isoform X1 [Ochotona princeps]|uniref:gamma-secretase subunit APH-1B isoform X1 n=1 Tax=Ochotona princeps TaxID=9978 RepID=UPI00271506AD|nr:gamma-secretase subunit APH-1B isoform X1 [Ochotona princeps]
MTAAVFFGCSFIAFGPALALYLFTIATDPLRVIFLIAGAFFWLVSLLLSSLIWFMARLVSDSRDGPKQTYLLIFGVLLSVLIQEVFRFAYYRLIKKASEGLKNINPDDEVPSMRLLAYVSGLGFGIMSGVFSFVNTLSDSLGPGTVGIHGDSPQFFLNSDLPKSSLWNKSAVSIYNIGAYGHLGLFCCWRQLPKPETLPAVSRQGLPSLQPALQITAASLCLLSWVLRGSRMVPFPEKSHFLMKFRRNCLDTLKQQLSERNASVAYILATRPSHLWRQGMLILGFLPVPSEPPCPTPTLEFNWFGPFPHDSVVQPGQEPLVSK